MKLLLVLAFASLLIAVCLAAGVEVEAAVDDVNTI